MLQKFLHTAALAALSTACLTAHATPLDAPTLAVSAAGAPVASGAVSLKVTYSDTLQGVSALYAVRVCAYDERSGASPRLVEVKAATPSDIELQLVDEAGVQVSQFNGSKAVCDYARFAAAFAARAHQPKELPHD